VLASLIVICGLPLPVMGQDPVVTTAPASKDPTPPPRTAEKRNVPQYLYTQLMSVGTGDQPHRCQVNAWGCMSSMCKQDVDPAAWLGHGRCWSQGNFYQCFFECRVWSYAQGVRVASAKQSPKKVKRASGAARFCTIDIFGQQCCQGSGGSVTCSGGGSKEK
jgi:hypothetical protein